MPSNDGGPAFPVLPPDTPLYRQWPAYVGISMRDYFAAAAIEAMGRWQHMHQGNYGDMARDAYRMADAMLKAREQ